MISGDCFVYSENCFFPLCMCRRVRVGDGLVKTQPANWSNVTQEEQEL